MIRFTARWSLRLGVLVAIALVIKKMVDSQREEPEPIRVADPPTPRRPPAPARPPSTPPATASPRPPAAAPAPPAAETPPTRENGSRTSEARPAPAPAEAKPAAEKAARPARAQRAPRPDPSPKPRSQMVSWVEPLDGVCPTTHPIKAKLGSRVFRKPGMPLYESSKPDRCYASEGAARRAGFNEAQR